MLFENENIEFKAKLSDEIYKKVIAFANTDGGMIYIGIDDQGNVVTVLILAVVCGNQFSLVSTGGREVRLANGHCIRTPVFNDQLTKIRCRSGHHLPLRRGIDELRCGGIFDLNLNGLAMRGIMQVTGIGARYIRRIRIDRHRCQQMFAHGR